MNNILLGIIAANVVFSFLAFNNIQLFEKYKLNVGAIKYRKQYYRILTSSFLHVDYIHLLFNMYALYVFAPIVIKNIGLFAFIIIYFASVVGGGLLSYFYHNREDYYSAVGASGGVVGIVFASILLFPSMKLQFIFLPLFSFEGWMFGLFYLLYSVYGMKNSIGNVGHSAHLGGALVGFLSVLMIYPQETLATKVSLFNMNLPIVGILGIPIAFLIVTLYQNKK